MKLKINKLYNPISIEENNYKEYMEHRENITYLCKEVQIDNKPIKMNKRINMNNNTRKIFEVNKPKLHINVSNLVNNKISWHQKHNLYVKEKLKVDLYVGNEYINYYHNG